MALFHFSVHTISRSKGTSACAAAAYRSGEKIHSDYDGITHDYTQKQNIVFSEILLPENTPAEFADRSYLWNFIETQIERQTNSKLAREFDIALPRELTFDQQRELIETFLQKCFVNDGGIADVCFHNPPAMNSKHQPIDINGHPTTDPNLYVYKNPHVHVMLPYRPMVSGKFVPKTQKKYICEKDGVQQSFTSEELKHTVGWEKLYNYTSVSGEKSWHSKSYASDHPEECHTQVNRYPKCEQNENPIVQRWNSPETLTIWRKAWADILNNKFEELGISEKVSHLSYAEQGLDLIPTIHEGKAITNLEKKYAEDSKEIHTEIRNLNNAIRHHNCEILLIEEIKNINLSIKEFFNSVQDRIDSLGQSIADTLERIRVELILIRRNLSHAIKLKDQVYEELSLKESYLKPMSPDKTTITTLSNKKNKLQHEYDSLNPLMYKKKRESIAEQIGYVESQIDVYKEHLKNSKLVRTEISKLQNSSDKLNVRIEKYNILLKEKLDDYYSIENSISDENRENVDIERIRLRTIYEMKAKQKINEIEFNDARELIDKKLINYSQEIKSIDANIRLKP